MDGHYGQNDDWDYENVEGVESDGQIIEAKAEDYLGKVRTQDGSVIRECLPYVNGQLPPDVEVQVVASVPLDYRYNAENNSSNPENLVAELVLSGEILVKHVQDCKYNQCVGR